MKQNNDLDRIFSGKLNNYDSDVAPDLWDRLEDRRNNNRSGIWGQWKFFGMLLIASIGIAYLLDTNTEQTDSHTMKSSMLSGISAIAKPAEEPSENIVENDAKLDEASTQTELSKSASPNVSFENTSTKVESEEQRVTTSKSKSNTKIDQQTNTENNSIVRNSTIQNDVAALSQKAVAKASEKATSNMGLRNDAIQALTLNAVSENTDANSSPAQLVENISSDFSDEAGENVKKSFMVDALKIDAIAQLPTKASEEKPDLSRITCPDFDKRLQRTYLDFLFTPGFAVRHLKAKDESFKANELSRKSTEQSNFVTGGGFRFSFLSKNKIAFRTGLMYNQIVERFYHTNVESWTESNFEAINSIFHPDGSLTVDYDTVHYHYSGTRVVNSYNKYHTIDVPLLIGYEKEFHGFVLTANVGTIVNVWFAQKGKFLSPENEVVEFTSDNIYNRLHPDGENEEFERYSAFKNNLGFNLYASFSCNYRLGSNYYLVFEPQVRYVVNSLTQSNYGLKQNYVIPAVSFGLRYQIN